MPAALFTAPPVPAAPTAVERYAAVMGRLTALEAGQTAACDRLAEIEATLAELRDRVDRVERMAAQEPVGGEDAPPEGLAAELADLDRCLTHTWKAIDVTRAEMGLAELPEDFGREIARVDEAGILDLRTPPAVGGTHGV